MARIKPPTPAALRAYKGSLYGAGVMRTRVGSAPHGLPDGRGYWAMLGACNPCGWRMPEGWNQRMTRQLRIVMQRLDPIEASGQLGIWSEAMLLAEIDPRRAKVLARRFRQNAILLIKAHRPTRLILLPADSGSRPLK